MSIELEPIEKRLEAATTDQGLWVSGLNFDTYNWSVRIEDGEPGDTHIAPEVGQGEDNGYANADFIAHAPSDIAALLAEVKTLRAQVDAVRKLHTKNTYYGNEDFAVPEEEFLEDPEAFDGADMRPFDVCAACLEIENEIRQSAENVPVGVRSWWPCATIRALGGDVA